MAVRFSWLDAARGVAAISVMFYHFDPMLNLDPLFRSSYLAVDLFFVMSGFVLAHSYGAKILSGRMTFVDFISARLIRLWPLYAAATVLGVSYYAAKLMAGLPDAPPGGMVIEHFVLNLAFIPAMTDLPQVGGIFPFSPAAWSLSAEMVGSLLFGAVLVRLSRPTLMDFAALSAAALLMAAILVGNLDLGWTRRTFPAGMIRMVCEMTLGMLVYQAHCDAQSRGFLPGILLAIAGTVVFVTFSAINRGEIAFEVLFALFVFPVAVAIAARTSAPRWIVGFCDYLGRISYPIYLLHMPVAMWVFGLWKLSGNDPDKAGRLAGCVTVLAVLLCSALLLRFFDEPVRAWLNAALRRRTSARALPVDSARSPLGL